MLTKISCRPGCTSNAFLGDFVEMHFVIKQNGI